jgi:hypothetical protein
MPRILFCFIIEISIFCGLLYRSLAVRRITDQYQIYTYNIKSHPPGQVAFNLLLDDFHSDNPDDYIAGFPWHPHNGIETVTYMLHGKVRHGEHLKIKIDD